MTFTDPIGDMFSHKKWSDEILTSVVIPSSKLEKIF